MNIQPDTSSPWLVEFNKQLLRGKQVLLYGNVYDEHLLNGEYVTGLGFIERYFRETGYLLVCRYDVVDGIEFAEPAMRGYLDQIRRAATAAPGTGTAPGTAGVPAAPPPPGRGALPGARTMGGAVPGLSGTIPSGAPQPGALGGPAAQPPAPSTERLPSQIDLALPILRSVLRQNQTPSAVTIQFSDKLVGSAQQQSRDETPALILIKKMVQEAALLDGPNIGLARNRRNALILVGEQLSGVAPWMYQDNPLLAVLQVPRPRREERAVFARRFLTHFHDGGNLGPDQDRVVEQFADLTDGLTTRDLHAVRRTSAREQMPITNPKRLIDYYKFGIQDDPWARLDGQRVADAQEVLGRKVIGQPRALEAVVDMLVTARVGLGLTEAGKAGKPKGTFFFVGPTGVGKTELAKALTELIFSDPGAFARFDMSEYALEHAAEKLTGSPPGFVGYEEGGQLTNRVLERPFSVLLFDEIEKAHGKIMDKFLQILEDGRLTDSRGQTADFSQAVIIFTSNIGSETMEDLREEPAGGLAEYPAVREHYLRAVRDHFKRPVELKGLGRPELLNRLGDNILVFDVLRPAYIRAIAQKFQTALAANALDRHGLRLTFRGEDVPELIERLMRANPENMQMGGRRVRTLMEEVVVKPLNKFVFGRRVPRGAALSVEVAPGNDAIEIR